MLESPEGTMTEKDQVSQTRQVDFYFSFLVPLTQLCLIRSRGDYKISMKNQLKTSPVELLPVRIFCPGLSGGRGNELESRMLRALLIHFDPFLSIYMSIDFEKNCAVILSQKTKFFLSKLRYTLICSYH